MIFQRFMKKSTQFATDLSLYSKVVKIDTFLPNRKIPMGHNIFPLFGLKAFKKCKKILKKKIFFHLAQAVQSFWKNHLVKWPFSVARWSENSKFDFFAFFQFWQMICCLKISSTWKKHSFEMHFVDLTQKIRNWEWFQKLQFQLISAF